MTKLIAAFIPFCNSAHAPVNSAVAAKPKQQHKNSNKHEVP